MKNRNKRLLFIANLNNGFSSGFSNGLIKKNTVSNIIGNFLSQTGYSANNKNNKNFVKRTPIKCGI
jgi:hypothetical protein